LRDLYLGKQLHLSATRFKSSTEIVLLYDFIVRFRLFDFKSTADIHYYMELCEIITVGNHDPKLTLA
jgi:hypothetical protein